MALGAWPIFERVSVFGVKRTNKCGDNVTSGSGGILSTLQSDCRTLHVCFRVLRFDRDRLLVATRQQVQIGGERWSLGDDLKPDAFDLAGHGARGIAGRLAPGARNRASGVGRAAA